MEIIGFWRQGKGESVLCVGKRCRARALLKRFLYDKRKIYNLFIICFAEVFDALSCRFCYCQYDGQFCAILNYLYACLVNLAYFEMCEALRDFFVWQ